MQKRKQNLHLESAQFLLQPYSIVSSFYIRMLIKKQIFKRLFKIPLWREIDNVTFYFLIFLVKIWIDNSISLSIHPGFIYFCFWWGCISRWERGRGSEGRALISNLCLINHRWYDVENLTLPKSLILILIFGGTGKRFVLKRWKKTCYILFY